MDIVNRYESKGIKSMFEWQVECLGNSRVLDEYKNLVYSAPTSAGKTLVAEILTIKTVLERRKKVIIVLPFVSVVREKMFYFQDIFSESGVRVEGFMGSQTPPGGFQSVHIAICTIEKANSLVNRLLEDGNISDLGAVVVDELHLLGDSHRGYILELLLTKLLYITKRSEDVHIQIIGMSATLPNLDMLSNWLQADLYKTNFRPIPLEEQCLMSGAIYNSKFELIRQLPLSKDLPKDNDNIIYLCLETIMQDCSVLIFCPTKNWCENLAKQISATFQNLGYSDSEFGIILRKQLKGDEIKEVLEQLKRSPVGLDRELATTVSFGVAFHHAGLTLDERDIIEGAFKRNVVRVLVATSTLSSGVNLPARRVIVRSPTFYSKPIHISTYKQMIGRAGRMGMDSAGESILICSPNDKNIAIGLMSKPFDSLSSCLEGEDRLMRAVLEAIASGVATNKEEVQMFIDCTLLMNSSCDKSLNCYCENILKQLQEYELIRKIKDEEKSCIIATPLGKACLSSSMSPQDGLTLFIELQRARESFVLETDLHMIYLVTPYSICSQWGDLDWLHFLKLWESLSAAMKRVGKLIGIQESFIYRCMRNFQKNNAPGLMKKYQVYKRFYTALALQDLVNEIPLNKVADKFNCPRGMLQSLQQSAATFAGMVTAFSNQLGWNSFKTLVSQFQDRLHFGIQSELLDLMRLQSLNGLRARAIFNMGIETVCQLATTNISIIENALNSAIPFQSEKIREGEDSYDANKRNNLKSVWITGKSGVTTTEAAEFLIREAQIYLEHEIGIVDVKWKDKLSDTHSQILDTIDASNQIHDSKPYIQEDNITSTVYNTSKSPTITTNALNIVNNETIVKRNVSLLEPLNESNVQHSTPNTLKNTSPNHSCHTNSTKLPDNFDSPNFESSIFNSHHSNSFVNLLTRSIDKNFRLSNASDLNNKSDSIFNSDNSRNVSLFEESFVVDTQLCGILDKKDNKTLQDHRDIKKHVGVSQDLLSIENVFSKSFDIEDDIQNIQKSTPDKLLESLDFTVPDSQINNCEFTESVEVTKKISFLINNKRRRKESYNDMQSPSKQVKLTEKCDVSNKKHPVDELKKVSKINIALAYTKDLKYFSTQTVDYSYCNELNVFRRICKQIVEYKKISMFVDFEETTNVDPRRQIGYNVLSNTKRNDFEAIKYTPIKCVFDKYCVKGIAIFIEEIGSFYIDLQSNNSEDVYLETVLSFFNKLLTDKKSQIVLYNCKNIFYILDKCCGITISCEWEDPLIADWLLDPECSIKSLSKMADFYCSYDIEKLISQYNNSDSIYDRPIIPCIKAWVTWYIMKSLKSTIIKVHPEIIKIFDVEMRALQVLAKCEVNGICMDKVTATNVLNQIKLIQKALESNAFKITGRRFRFTSSSEVAKVLGMYKGRKTSTSKRILEKMENSLAQIVVYWRKLNNILTKNIFPLISKSVQSGISGRIFGSYWTHTSTGRMSMQEPNLQSMPRNFKLPPDLLMKDSSENVSIYLKNTYFSCRDIFLCTDNNIFVSADYCQLELRLLAHMSNDTTLLRIVKSGKDIFTEMASCWKCIPQEKVDEDLRQKTKQMCYGIIYGMGVRSLAQNLDVGELEADVFMRTFHSAYPGIKTFVNLTIESCKRLGYVETLSGRRRYLSLINSDKYSEKSHAERQAVNTTIQGSAADILKSAMISVQHKVNELHNELSNIKLVLLLHDELVYELPENKVYNFLEILKESMEKTLKLNVPLPVKVKFGKSWGNLHEIQCQ
ncbi:DNA polymerase theta [Arctopsyche grandis]|uniref:DNA polymerase theta n=1 Tax=Arctopsyche grandis TaxID=121162 RepID=UPI00406D8E84